MTPSSPPRRPSASNAFLPGPVERVWSSIVEPDKPKPWFVDGSMDLRVGGAVSLVRRNSQLAQLAAGRDDVAPPESYAKNGGESRAEGKVTACEPPHLIAFTWAHSADPGTEATSELTPPGAQVLLVVAHRRPSTDGLLLGVSTGWHAHLMILRARLEESEPPRFRANFATLRETDRQRCGM